MGHKVEVRSLSVPPPWVGRLITFLHDRCGVRDDAVFDGIVKHWSDIESIVQGFEPVDLPPLRDGQNPLGRLCPGCGWGGFEKKCCKCGRIRETAQRT